MQTPDQLAKSIHAAIKDADDQCRSLNEDIFKLKQGGSPQKIMPRARAKLAVLTQRLHEFSAYHNARHTGPKVEPTKP